MVEDKQIQKHQDLDNSTMSLGDHLEELRSRLIYAIVGLAIGAIIGLLFAPHVINFMQRPYMRTIQRINAPTDPNQAAAPVVSPVMQSLAPADGFISYLKIAMIIGVLISSPWVFYHIWMFVAAGLYKHEKKYVYMAVPFSVILFIAGSLFFVLVVAPITMKFLVNFNMKFLGVQSNFTFKQYMAFVTRLMLVFGIAFQTPTAIFFLNRTGILSINSLRKARKYVFLSIFVLSAMVTPPDVISQVTLALPLYILFEIGILISLWSDKKRKEQLE